jgi:hypothetical protein
MPATGSTAHSRWQESFRYSHQALAQLETLFDSPALNEREQQGLIKALETTLVQRGQGGATLLRSRYTLREVFRLEQLQQLWADQPGLQAVWLFGSRAMDHVQRVGRRISAAPTPATPGRP